MRDPRSPLHDSCVGDLVDHLFRQQAGRLTAWLTRAFGAEHLELVEDVVQDALVKALQQWPFSGVPDNPRAWLIAAARNQALDVLRRQSAFRERADRIRQTLEDDGAARDSHGSPRMDGEIEDDQLRLIFLCCHPALSREGRVALTLKVASGFSVAEIARALLSEPSAVAQRITRAKRALRDARAPFDAPAGVDVAPRLDAALDVLYLLFNEGYSAHAGENLVRFDLCGEAVRLTELLADSRLADRPVTHALLALMLLQAARLPARVDGAGELVLLVDQDRALWDRQMIAAGLRRLDRSAEGPEVTPYHLEAGIAACHATAAHDADVDWPQILLLYDELRAMNPSPVVALNRAVATAKVHGPEAGLAALDGLETHASMRRYYLLPALRADLLMQVGESQAAIAAYVEALTMPCSEPERRFLHRRIVAARSLQS